jgi:hypothetical protein
MHIPGVRGGVLAFHRTWRLRMPVADAHGMVLNALT